MSPLQGGRFATAVAVILAVLVAGGLPASGSVMAGSVSASATSLTARLLRAADLPAGWEEYPSAGFDTGLPTCLEAVYREAPDQQASAEATFSAPGGLASFQDRLVGFSHGAAAMRTAGLERSVASCRTSPNGPVLAIKALAFSPAGRQSRAFVVTLGRRTTSRVYGVLVIARQGETVVVATHGAVSGNTAQALRLARSAIDKAA